MIQPTPDRGQTLHDFAIGMSLFLLVLGYVFAFIPGLFTPFSPETDSTAIRVDRTADFLTRDLLVEGDQPGLLNVSCTEYFFGVDDATADDCARLSASFADDRAAGIRERAMLPSGTDVNVTMHRTDGIATHPETGELLAVGPSLRGSGGRAIRAVRVVSFLNRDYRFVVRIS